MKLLPESCSFIAWLHFNQRKSRSLLGGFFCFINDFFFLFEPTIFRLRVNRRLFLSICGSQLSSKRLLCSTSGKNPIVCCQMVLFPCLLCTAEKKLPHNGTLVTLTSSIMVVGSNVLPLCMNAVVNFIFILPCRKRSRNFPRIP